MPFPRKFKNLLELTYAQVEQPSYVWLNYAVCGCEADSCGWQGWIVESAFVRREGDDDLLLPSDDHLDCPECRKPLFRTEVTYRFEPSGDQTAHMIPGVDYVETPMEYEGEEGPDIPVAPARSRGAGLWREVDPEDRSPGSAIDGRGASQ